MTRGEDGTSRFDCGLRANCGVVRTVCAGDRAGAQTCVDDRAPLAALAFVALSRQDALIADR
jgi:hypothetical protein